MNILYIHQYFRTPAEPFGTRSYWIARELIKRGHKVTFVTGTTKEFDQPIFKTVIDGINVIYIKEEYGQSLSFFARIRAFLGFAVKGSRVALNQKDVDLVIATSTPLTIGIPALLLKWVKKIPYVFEVRDLWPEGPIQLGAIRNPIVAKLLRFFEKTIYRNSVHVVALSPGMLDGVTKYIPASRTSMIPNMSKKDEFWPREKNKELMNRLGLSDATFKIIHFGSLGLANGAETIIESAKLLNDDHSIDFLFVGGGSTEDKLKVKCAQYGLTNVKFLGRYPMKETSEIVNFCDVSIVSFSDVPILYTNSPNKLFDSLSAGKPVIVNSAGWTKDMVEEFGCGYYVDPHQPRDLVEKIKLLQSDSVLREQLGEQSRWLAENKYDKSILCKQFADIIDNLKI